MPEDPADLPELLASLPSFSCARRREWVLVSDCPPITTERTLDLLEATTVQVERIAGALGIRTRSPKQRHLSVLFSSLEHYRLDARQRDSYEDPNTIGHYAAHARRSMLTAASASPELRSAMALIDGDDNARNAPPSRSARSNAPTRAASPQLRAAVDAAIDDARRLWMGMAAHEAAHQILCERQVHPPGAACPAWLAEGFACCFETERTTGDFGPDFDVAPRRERLQEALSVDGLLPLGVLVASSGRPSLGARGSVDWYAQSWGLVTWLFRQHTCRLTDYMLEIWEGRGGASAAERMSAFERVFGSITEVESAWRAAWQPRADDRPHAMRARRPAARTST